jgi:hypothetical protein
MEANRRVVSVQMTDHEAQLMGAMRLRGSAPGMRVYRTNFVSDRYTLYRYDDLAMAFADNLTLRPPSTFEVHLNQTFKVADALRGRMAVVCQWDSQYVGAHVGTTGSDIRFTRRSVARLCRKLAVHGAGLSLSQRSALE